MIRLTTCSRTLSLLNNSRPVYSINTEIIKQYQKSMLKKNDRPAGSLMNKPLTLQQQIAILNSPKMIKHIQVMEYGIKLPPTSKWQALLLLAIGAFLYLHYQSLPTAIVERYLSISAQIKQNYVGYIGSFFALTHPATLLAYLPMVTVIHHSTRYIRYYSLLLAPLLVVNSLLGTYLKDQELKKFEVWKHVKITCGEGIYHAIGFALWTFLGFKNGLGEAFNTRVFLKSIPGLGIIRRGIPIGYIIGATFLYQIARWAWGLQAGGRSELIVSSAVAGICYGLLMRRFRFLKKTATK